MCITHRRDFGENGTGKSTIVDSIDFVLQWTRVPLKNAAYPVPRSKYMASLGEREKDLEVSIKI